MSAEERLRLQLAEGEQPEGVAERARQAFRDR
jgi:hypothetical protein